MSQMSNLLALESVTFPHKSAKPSSLEFPISHNTWIHRVARIAVRPLARTNATPNQITTLRLGAGLVAGAAFAMGDMAWIYWGSAFFVLAVLLDRADGDLARMTGRTSPWGHTYDLVSDAFCNAWAFVGIGIGLHSTGGLGSWAIPLGVLAGLAIVAVLWLVIRIEAEQGPRAGELGGFGGFDADDAMLIVPLALSLGGAVPLLVAAAVGAPLFALIMSWHLAQRLKSARASAEAPKN
jgi:archaetidylinositol phosphate synthase